MGDHASLGTSDPLLQCSLRWWGGVDFVQGEVDDDWLAVTRFGGCGQGGPRIWRVTGGGER